MAQKPKVRENKEPMIRQWEMLMMIPQRPTKRSTADIISAIREK